MRAWVWVAALLPAVGLAGCVGDAGSDEDGTGEDPLASALGRNDPAAPGAGPAAEPVAPAPSWVPGDWWRWRLEPRDAPAFEVTTVVTSVDAETYRIGFTEVDAGLATMFFHYVPMTAVSTSDLSWDVHHEALVWFSFPLTEGKTWEGVNFHEPLTFNATWSEVETPAGPAPGFLVVGVSADGGERVRVHWSPDLGSMTRLEVRFGSGDAWLVVRLLDAGAGHTDTVHVLEYDLVVEEFHSLASTTEQGQPPATPQTFTLGASTTHVSIGCYGGGAPGSYGFRLQGADGSYGCTFQETAAGPASLARDFGPVAPGSWNGSFHVVGQGFVFAELFLIRAVAETPGS